MSTNPQQPVNPFPGLRPFRSDEHHLFFGREDQTTALLQLLRTNRFLAVVGTSGSGKSSLVRAGMIAELHGGTMTHAGSTWEVMILRPGGSPIENLARAMVEADLYDAENSSTLPRLLATLRRSRFGLVEAMKQSDVFEPGTNLLVVVDQFEELFRFRQLGVESEEAATAFVNLLLTAAQQPECPIYVAITMRSDYLGDCSEIPGLAEAVNEGEYLIPRLMRDQKRDAIEKPIGVGGAKISPLLVQRFLNDVGDDPDQLPVLQHALMRMWEVWSGGRDHSRPIEFSDFEATGGLASALSNHADEIYDSLPDDSHRAACEKIFKTLTEKGDDNRGIRRPTRLSKLQAIAGVDRECITTVLDAFRNSGVTFLMPGMDVELSDRTVIDLSHESLMRGWQRLRNWVEEEAQSARIFRRLLDTARLWSEGKAGLFRDPDLQIALSWREEEQPNAQWAEQYGGDFETAIGFLETSNAEVEAERQAKEAARQRELAQAQHLAEAQQLQLEQQQRAAGKLRKMIGSLAVVAIIAVIACIAALFANQRANSLALQAQQNEERALRNEEQVKEALNVVAAQKTEVEGSLIKAQAAEEAAEGEREKAVRHYYFAKMAQVNDTSLDGSGFELLDNTFRRLSGLRTTRPPFGWEWHYLRSLTRQDEMTLHGHTVDGYVVAWSPDAHYLASGGSDNCIRIWDAVTGQAILSFPAPWGIYALAWSPDGRQLASSGGHAGHHLSIWNPWTGEKIVECGHHTRVTQVLAWDATGARLASVGDDHTIRVWDAATGRELASRDGAARFALAWRPGDEGWSYADTQGAVRLWDGSQSDPRLLLPGNGLETEFLAWSPDGALLAVESPRGLVRALRVSDQAALFDVRVSSNNAPGNKSCFAWSHDGTLLATLESEQIRLTDAAGQQVAMLAGHQAFVHGVAWSPRGLRLASINAGWNGEIKIWSVPKNRAPRRTIPIRAATGDVAEFVAWSPDSSKLIIAAQDNTARVWDVEQGRELARLKGHSRSVTAVGWSPRGDLLVTGDAGGAIKLWSADHSEEMQTVQQGSRVSRFDWSPQGDRLLSAPASGKTNLWDTSHREEVRLLRDFPHRLAALRPDGREVVAAEGYALSLFDAESGKKLSSISTSQLQPQCIAWSPDGKKIAMEFSPQIYVFDRATGRVLITLSGHTGEVRAIEWSPDGTRLATGGSDNTIRLWDEESGTNVLTLRGHEAHLRCLAWSPDGTGLASVDESGMAMIWDASEGYRFDHAPNLAVALGARVSADPTDAIAWRLRGCTRARAGQWDLAEQDLQKWAELVSGNDPRVVMTGWWTVAAYDAQDATNPFTLKDTHGNRSRRPQWYMSADDPNGFVPLTDPSSLFLARVYAADDCEIALCQNDSGWATIWCNAQKVNAARPQLLALRRGWNIIAAQPSVTSRPREGAYLRLSAQPYDMALALVAAGRSEQALELVEGLGKSGESEVPLLVFSKVLKEAGAALVASGQVARSAEAYAQAYDLAETSRGRMILANEVSQRPPVLAELRRLRPDSPQLAAASALATDKAGNGEQAVAERAVAESLYEQALAAQPDDAVLATQLAETLLEDIARNDPTAAEAQRLRQALQDGRIRGPLALGIAYALQGDFTRSAEWAQRDWNPVGDGQKLLVVRAAAQILGASIVQRVFPDDLPVQQVIVELLAEQGKWDEAAAAFERLRSLHAAESPRWLQTGFWVIGPYPGDFELKTAYPPESNLDPLGQGSVAEGQPRWQPAPSDAEGRLDLARIFDHQNHICDYSQMRVYSPQERTVAILLGSDDSVRVWVNGEVVHENVVGRQLVPEDDVFLATLRQGWNTVLAKVANGDGDHGLCLRLSDQPRDMTLPQAEMHGKNGEWRHAIEILSPAIEQWPEDARLIGARARAYHHLGQWDAAITDWNRALEFKSEDEELRRQRAHSYQDSRQWDLALADWTQLSESRPNPWYLRMQAYCLDELGRWEEALAVHNQAVDREQVSPWAMLSFRGVHFARRGEWQKATQDLSQAIETLPENTDWWIARDLALAALMAGDGAAYRKAIAQFDGRTRENASAEQAMWLVLVCVVAPNTAADVGRDRLLQVALQSPPEWQTPLTAAIHFRVGEFHEADQLYGENPGGPESQFLAAMVKHRLGVHEGAKAWLTRGTNWMQRRLDENPDRSIPKDEWWCNWALKWVLWKEAEGLIEDPRPRPKSDQALDDASEVDQFKPE